LIVLLLPLLLLRLYWRGFKAPFYRERWRERLGFLESANQPGCIWLHAVSVGEVQAIAPLIRKLLTDQAQALVVTTTTPTGAQRVRELFGEEVRHYFAPFDALFVVKRFFARLQPRLLILVETEIWPNLIYMADESGVPTLLANARLSMRSARRYHRFAGLTRETLQKITMIAPHGEADAQRFCALGARRSQVEVTGSIKFDIRLPASLRERADVLRREWGTERPVWLAASTHEGEDEQVLAAHRTVKAAIPDCLLVLVPRHPERFDQVAELIQSEGFQCVRRSERQHCSAEIDVFLGDSMGELTLFMGAADVAFIGGSLVPHGGHNMLEAAAQGVPVLIGPHMFNFAEISELFLRRQAALQVSTSAELARQLIHWLGDASERSQFGERGRELVDRNRGALQRLYDLVQRLLSDTAGRPR
jgi:3-deoxy-D-manno-octulosonic-acid transferase